MTDKKVVGGWFGWYLQHIAAYFLQWLLSGWEQILVQLANINTTNISKVLVLMLENMVGGVLAAASWRSGSWGDSGCRQGEE